MQSPPEKAASPRVKRPRKIWSCLECRRKKLQCDHGKPACGRCMRTGAAATCTYASDKTPYSHSRGRASIAPSTYTEDHVRPAPTTQPPPPPVTIVRDSDLDLYARLEGLERRITQHESITASSLPAATPLPGPSHAAAQSALPRDPAVDTQDEFFPPGRGQKNGTTIRGAAFRTKANGPTCTDTCVEYTPGLTSFTNDAFATFSAFDEIQRYTDRSENRGMLSCNKTPGKDVLKNLLPPLAEADRLIQIYLQSFDHIYPVLHLPSFERQYAAVWLDDQQQDPRFLVLTLVIVAIAYCLTSMPVNSSETKEQSPRDKATMVLDACECWLQPRIQRYDALVDFQINFLLLVARQLNARRNKRTYCNCGHILRIFQCAALHRDPDQLTRETSALDKELRRRLWACLAEFELQAAFEHGMIAQPWIQQSDVRSPANVSDDTLNPLPLAAYTRTTFISLAGRSLRFRHRLNTALNDISQRLSFDEAVKYTHELREFLQSIPNTWHAPGSEAVRALLTINLHQYIVTIHEQQLRHATSPVEKQFSRLAIIESTIRMIDCHKASLDSGSIFIEVHYGDHRRAAISLCYAYVTADPMIDSTLIYAMRSACFQTITQAMDMYGEKVLRFGGGRVDLWLICAAEGLMKTKEKPENRAIYLQDAVTKFTDRFNRLMYLTGGDFVDSTARKTSQPVLSVADRTTTTAVPQTGWPADEAAMLDELVEWTFDDFAFDFVDFSCE